MITLPVYVQVPGRHGWQGRTPSQVVPGRAGRGCGVQSSYHCPFKVAVSVLPGSGTKTRIGLGFGAGARRARESPAVQAGSYRCCVAA
jgi:hypothetical protein